MINIATSIGSLLLGTGLLLLGMGLQGTLLGLRAGTENYSMTMVGLVMSSYFIGFALGSYLCPRVIRQYGHIRAYAAMVSLISAAAIAHALNTEPAFWIILRIITGVCIVGSYMVIESWLNVLANNTLRGQFFGAYMMITLFAMAAGQHLLRLGDVAGFELFAISTILISLALIPVVMTRIPQPDIHQPDHLPLRRLYDMSPAGVVTTMCAGVMTGAFWGMQAVYASSIGLDETDVAWLMSIIILGGAVLQWPLGFLSDRFDRRTIIALCAFAGAAMALLGALVNQPSHALFVLSSLLFGGFTFTLYGLAVAHVNDRISQRQRLEAAQGLLQIYGLGAILGPLLASQAIEVFDHWGLPLFYAVVMICLGFFILYRMRRAAAVPLDRHNEFVPMARTSPVALEMSPLNDSPEDHSEQQ